MVGIEQHASHRRESEIPVGQFDQRAVAELVVFAQVGKRVLVAAAALHLAGQRQPQPRLADQVERNVGRGDVFFEGRRVPEPLRQPLAEDQRVVTEAQERFEAHMCFTSSGSS